MRSLVFVFSILLLFSCSEKQGKEPEPEWKVKYEYPVFISAQKPIDFGSSRINTVNIAESDSKESKRIYRYINERSEAIIDSLKKGKYKHLSEIQHKIEFVENDRGDDGFNFILLATEDKDCEDFLLDFVKLAVEELHYITNHPNEQLRNAVESKLDSIKRIFKSMSDLPREEIDEEKVRQLEKIYSKLLEKQAELRIAEAGRTPPFFYVNLRPQKVKMED